MAEPTENMTHVSLPSAGEVAVVNVNANQQISLDGVDLESTNVDIVGDDVVMSDPDSGAKIVFAGMALLMFDDSVMPSIFMDGGGEAVASQQLLGRVGEVGNLSVKEFIAVSSLIPEGSGDKTKLGDADEGTSGGGASEDTEKSKTSDEEMVFTSVSQAQAQRQTDFTSNEENQNTSTNTSNKPITAVDEKGTIEEVPIKTSSSSSSNTSSTPPEFVSPDPDTAPPEPEVISLFEARLLQVARTVTHEDTNGDLVIDELDDYTVQGGGGADASFFNPENDVQYSTEVISNPDYAGDQVVYADSADYFGENTMARVVEITPQFPDGFVITNITVSGLPAGFELEGMTASGGGYFVDNPTANDSGNYQFILTYDVPLQTLFELGISITAEYDQDVYEELNPDGPFVTPTETEITVEGVQAVEVKDVYSASDLNYSDADGNEVWVLANDPNENRIFTGAGDDVIYGNSAVDTVNAGAGDDVIYGGEGDDLLVGGAGDDTLHAGTGNDTLRGDAGVDTADFSEFTQDIVLDMRVTVNGYATAYIDQGGAETKKKK